MALTVNAVFHAQTFSWREAQYSHLALMQIAMHVKRCLAGLVE